MEVIDFKKIFGKELKQKIIAREPVSKIGIWAFSFYWENIHNIDLDFRRTLLTLNTMELGYEFAFTYEELEEIADKFIAGKDVVL